MAILLLLCQSLWLGRKYDISPGHFSLEKQNRLLRQRQGLFRSWTWLFAGTRPPENIVAAISVRRFLTRGGHLGVFHCATCIINVIYKDTNKLQYRTRVFSPVRLPPAGNYFCPPRSGAGIRSFSPRNGFLSHRDSPRIHRRTLQLPV